MKKYCFGVDIGGTFTKMGLFNITGELIEKWEIPTRIEEGSKYILPDVARSIAGKMAEKNIAKEEVAGIGYGVPAPVSEGGVVVDAMFIDEGFGSLDDESLNQALNAIMMMSQGNKLIGIISHVNELKSRIDKKIVVKKSSNGSSISLVV